MNSEILNIIKEKGLLLEKEIFEEVKKCEDTLSAKLLLENLEKISGQKMITRSSLTKNYEFVREVVDEASNDKKKFLEKVFVKLGVSLEVTKEKIKPSKKEMIDYTVHNADTTNNKKIEVKDFVKYFRSRYQQAQKILMQRANLENLTSINKISNDRQALTVIGIVTEKRITKNKNLMVQIEDLTGEIKFLVKPTSECFTNANELQLDDVVAVRGSGNREIIFAYDVVYPDSMKIDKPKFEDDFCVAFVSDVHAGSNKHLGKEFEKFIYWLNSDNELAKKIKYLFFVGDNVDGVGVFPGQEKLLKLKTLGEQYDLLSSYLKKVPKRITMFMCPGQHDSVRVAEPQPTIDKHYGKSLHEIPNLVLTTNPSIVKILEKDKEFKILMYHGASIHSFINSIEELRLMKAHSCPAKAVKHMLKRRHLAPTHSSVVYVPNAKKDYLAINEVPDILCTGEVHRLDIERHNGTLIITGSCWQSQTDFEEKVGNIPDPCKVPILNLKTNELKILDFSK
jgi:DNA polymerase II small subunit|tara:strand:+ start:768 stop:2294 length:1527 start_codon:yes stop_codon:yes gene_type:complete